jgi:heterodisulfide reductase subunit A
MFMETLEACGINKYLFEMANLRNQDSWVHSKDPEGATKKAKDLVRMSVARAGRLQTLNEKIVPIIKQGLVIGGGVAGSQTALDLADNGYDVIMVEKTPSIGGTMAQLDKTFPTMDCSI